MSYTVVGMFPNNELANEASKKLSSAGFPETDYRVSKFRSEGEYANDDYDYEEDESTRGFWDKLFGSDDNYDRKAYSYAGSKSNVVTVYTEDKERAEEASRIMDEAGAISVDDQLSDDFYTKNPQYSDKKVMGIADTNLGDNANYADDKIQVVNEEVNVGKKEVETGGVRVHSRVIEKPVEENLRLKEERVYIKRQPVNKAITDADEVFQNKTIEMTESKEVPVVEKTARVVEEISIGKNVENVEHTVAETVRETKVDIEDTTSNNHHN